MIFKDNSILVDASDYTKIAKEVKNSGQEFILLRSLASHVTEKQMSHILKEFQIFNWKRRTLFCGVCGKKNIFDEKENCKICPECGEKSYPFLFPAVIVSIIKGDQILLAHNASFPGNMHSVVAGFVDLGETLEESVIREIREEVGVEIKNLKYVSSQNWGFSSSLMVGFTAEYSSGEIKVDGIEIDRAGWFSVDNLPELPPEFSIARALINKFIDSI